MLPKANSVFLGIVACVLSWLSSASALSITLDKHKVDYWNGWIILTALILIAVGFVVTLAGYRLFKLLIIVAGFLFGSGVTYYALYLTLEWPLWGIILTAILAGLIVAVLFHCLYLFAVFMLGFSLGFVSMYYICVAFLDPVLSGALSGNWQFYITAAIVLVAGALVGIVTLLLERHLLIFFSSIGGAFLLVLGIDYFTGDCQLCSYLAVWEGNEPSLDDITITTWVMLGLWGLSALVGLIVQYGLTARNYSAKKKNNKNKKCKDKVEVSAVQMEHPSEQHTSLVYVEVDTGSHSQKSYGAIPYLPPPPLNPELHHVNATSPPSTAVFNPNVKVF